MGRNRRRKTGPHPFYCDDCGKIIWQSKVSADAQVENLRSCPGFDSPELLNSYQCPAGRGWHIGHNYKLRWISICIGEHR